MCSLAEDELPVGPAVEKTPTTNLEICRRCLVNNSQVLLRKTDPYCEYCYMKYASHKFRSTLGKERAIQHNEKILLAYSGGLSSGCLLTLVRQGFQEATASQKRFIFQPIILYIDESCVIHQTDEERLANLKSVQELAQHCRFDLHWTGLEQSLVSDPSEIDLYSSSDVTDCAESKDRCRKLFDSVATLTAKEDLLLRLKQKLMVMAAVKLTCSKVFVGSTATRLAGQLLTAVGQGRGAQIDHEIGFMDDRDQVPLMRPMREFADREVAYLAHFLTVPSLSLLAPFTQMGNSIGRLTQEFIVQLSSNFPSTVSTLFRTGDKLRSTGQTANRTGPDQDRGHCLVCGSSIEESAACNAYSARLVSQTISRSGPQGSFGSGSSCSSGSGPCGTDQDCGSLKTCCKEQGSIHQEDLALTLCYGCRITWQDVGQPELLPESLQEEIRQRSRRNKMRQSVQQFLL